MRVQPIGFSVGMMGAMSLRMTIDQALRTAERARHTKCPGDMIGLQPVRDSGGLGPQEMRWCRRARLHACLRACHVHTRVGVRG